MFSTRKRCLIGSLIWGYQKFCSIPPKNGFLAQKRPNLDQNWHFWSNMGIFDPFNLMLDQKRMRTRCVGGFFRYVGTVVPKHLLPPAIIRNFAQKRPHLAPNWHFGQNIGIFGLLRLRCDNAWYIATSRKNLPYPPVLGFWIIKEQAKFNSCPIIDRCR